MFLLLFLRNCRKINNLHRSSLPEGTGKFIRKLSSDKKAKNSSPNRTNEKEMVLRYNEMVALQCSMCLVSICFGELLDVPLGV